MADAEHGCDRFSVVGCAPLSVGETVGEAVGETPDGGIALVMAG